LVNASVGTGETTRFGLILAKIQLARSEQGPDRADDRDDEQPAHEYLRELGRQDGLRKEFFLSAAVVATK
jgi:hypothetical protein